MPFKRTHSSIDWWWKSFESSLSSTIKTSL